MYCEWSSLAINCVRMCGQVEFGIRVIPMDRCYYTPAYTQQDLPRVRDEVL